MRRVMFFKIGGKNIHLTRLIGAFLLFAALIMFLRAGAIMFDSWDALKQFPDCLRSIESENSVLAQMKYEDCKDSLYKATGVQLRGDQDRISSRQFWTALLGPIASLFFWALVFVFGVIIYRTGNIVLPIEQTIREIPSKPAKKSKGKK